MAINNAIYEFDSQTISTTEYSLTNNSTSVASRTSDAVISVWIDTNAMVAGDEFNIFLREKVTASGTQRQLLLATLTGPQASPFISSPFQVGMGWDVTMQRVAGSDRAFSWTIRGVE